MAFINNYFIKIVFFGYFLSVLGCSLMPSHIHNTEHLASAEKVTGELAEYAKNSPAMYQAMITNLGKFEVEENRVLDDLIQNRTAAIISDMPFKTPNQLWVLEGSCDQNSIIMECKILDNISSVENEVLKKANSYLKKMKVIKIDIASASAAIKATKEAIEDAKSDVTNWNKSIALLKKGLSDFSSPSQDDNAESTNGSIQELSKKLQETGKKEVEFIDANGKTKTESIAKILGDQLKVENKDGQVALDLPDAPGNTLVILTLGLELAEIQKRRAIFRMSQLAERAELYEDINGGALLAKDLLLQDSKKFKGLKDSKDLTLEIYMMNKSILSRAEQQKLNKLKTLKNAGFAKIFQEFGNYRADMLGMLRNVQNLVLSDLIAIRAKHFLELASARLDHQESIQLSRINDEAYMAAERSAANSLVNYHRGGFTGEDAANIISIAQAIALGVIAGGVL